jgi:hypothetical protein
VNDPIVGPYTFAVSLPPNTSINISNEAIEGTFSSLLYSTVGVWDRKLQDGGFKIEAPRECACGRIAGAAAAGVATPRADLPTTGTAQYSGQFLGRHDSDGATIFAVHAEAQAVANFGSGMVSFTTTNTHFGVGGRGAAAPSLDLTGSMTFQSSGGVRQNSLSGPVSTRGAFGDPAMTGEVRGNFFGPASASSAPPELAGTVAVKAPDSAPDREGRSVIGGFVMKR